MGAGGDEAAGNRVAGEGARGAGGEGRAAGGGLRYNCLTPRSKSEARGSTVRKRRINEVA